MNRFINCDCIKNKKGELIPLWKIDWKLDSEYLDKGIIILVYPFTNKEGEKRFIFAIPMENGSLSSNNLNYLSYEQARLEGIKSVCNELLRK